MPLQSRPEGPGGSDGEIGLHSRAGLGRDPARADDGLGPQKYRQTPFPGARQGREVVASAGVQGDRRVHLQAGSGHASHQQPVLGVADAQPSTLGGSVRIDQVRLPQGVGRHGLLGRDRVLRILDRFDGEENLPEEPAGRLA